MNAALGGPALAALAGCTAIAPQTGDQFIAQTKGGFLMEETAEAPLPFDQAMKNLRPVAERCMDYADPGNARHGIGPSHERGRIVDLGPGHAQILLQSSLRGVNQVVPPGGLIVLVADITAQGATTRIVVHSAFNYIGHARAIQAWALGTSTSCLANIGL